MREDWIDVELEEVCEILDNLRKPINSNERNERIKGKDINELFPYYGATGKVGYIDDYLTNGDYVLLGEDAAPFLDFTKDVAYKIVGKTWVNNHAHILKSHFNDDFLLHFLNQFQYRDYVTGTTRLKLTQGALKRMPVKVAPLPIQRAIVSKIEALFSDLDNGIANFKKAQAQLKIYRQAVLKKAFEGELTKEWREKQSNLPTAEELLKQIKEERQNHYDQQIDDWKKAVKEWEKNGKVGSKPSKPTEPKELPPLKKEELDELPNLPDGWVWCKNLNVATKITDGEHITPKRENSGYYLLSARNIQNGYISYTNVDYVGENEYLRIRKRCNPEFGDILISCSGSVGRISLVPKNSNFVMVRSVALVKTNVKIYNPKFLEYLFLSPELQSQIEDGKKATAQANLFLEPIGKLNVILCSLQEQNQIVQEIERRLSVCDKMEQSIKESIEKAEALRQSILKKAFEGKLLSQAEIAQCKKEADYEPASELLKKIKADASTRSAQGKMAILRQAQDAKIKKPIVKNKSKQ